MADEELVIRASLDDDLSAPLADVADAVDDVGNRVDRTDRAARRAGGNGGGFGALIGKAKSLVKGLGIAGVAGAVGLVATSLVKGFNRLTSLENAEAKLLGLGHSAKSVDKIMKNALAAVKGTAFGMDEAATTAAGAVAAGIKPGKELEKMLTLVGDSATIAGVGMSEMGAIWNKVATSNKIQGDVIAQLSDAGIPIVSLLAKELGIAGDEVVKLASDGEIGFKTFQKAMEAGMGGAAQKSGDTMQGAFKNVQASLGRIGANVLTGVYPQIKTGLAGAITWLGSTEDSAKDLGTWIGEKLAGAIEWAGDKIDKHGPKVKAFVEDAARVFEEDLWPVIQDVGGFIKDDLVPALMDLATWMAENEDIVAVFAGTIAAYLVVVKMITIAQNLWTAAQIALNVAMSANPVGLVIAALVLLGGSLYVLYQRSEKFRTAVDWLWNTVLKPFGKWLGGVLVGAFKMLGKAYLTMAEYGLKAFGWLLDAAFYTFDKILLAAEKGLGWIPGLGDKIKGARESFSEFGDKTRNKLDRMADGIRNAKDALDELGKKKSTPEIAYKVSTNGITSGMPSLSPPRPAIPTGVPGRGVPVGDTASSRGFGGVGGGTLARHRDVTASLGGGYQVSNMWTGGGGHGHGSGDHQAGRAVDVTGRNLSAYAREARRQGGYASIHGSGASKHVHHVPAGDTHTSRRPGRSGGGGRVVTIGAGAVQVHVTNPSSNVDVTQAVRQALRDLQREAEEMSD